MIMIELSGEGIVTMEYFNTLLENALVEVLERHKKELFKQFHINIEYEELKKAMQEYSLDLLKEMLHYIENSNDDDSYKIREIRSMLIESGIRCKP